MGLIKGLKRIAVKVYFFLKESKKNIYWLLCYYGTIYGKYDKQEYKLELRYLREKGKLQLGRGLVFPYDFYEKYKPDVDEVAYDATVRKAYAYIDGKRLYFPSDNKKWVAGKINNLRIEQDINSPHCYYSNAFLEPEMHEVFVDVGVAEGKEAIEVIDKVKEEILIEYSDAWIETLRITFAPWKEKVKIIKAFASDGAAQGCIILDDILKDEEDYFLKLDVEGAELKVLKGAEKRLRRGGNQMCGLHLS